MDTYVTLEALKDRTLKEVTIEMGSAVTPGSELGEDLICRRVGEEVVIRGEQYVAKTIDTTYSKAFLDSRRQLERR